MSRLAGLTYDQPFAPAPAQLVNRVQMHGTGQPAAS